MKKLLFLATILCFAASCENPGDGPVEPAKPIQLTTRGAEKVAADNAFALEFFRETLDTADDATNAFVSPFSLTMALGMLYNGTSDAAGDEMAAALGVDDFTSEEINAHYKNLVGALLKADPKTALAIANSIWTRDGYPVEKTFYDVNKTWYDAAALERDFTKQSTVDEINKWCYDKTRGKIPTIIQNIPPDVVMYLINAVYFKSRWATEFKKADTRDENFTLADGSTKTVKMMNQTADVRYYEDETTECVELPYGNGAFGMVVMMPTSAETPFDDFVNSLDADAYGKIVAGLHECEVQLKLPRFKQECEFKLNDAVRDLGMESIFQEGGLTKINSKGDLVVSEIRQKTFVEVNEEGTEAAAVTVVVTAPTSVGPGGEIYFHADRPFIYLIRERSTGAILFMGRMDNPAE